MLYMGSALFWGTLWGPLQKGAVLYRGPKQGPYFRELRIYFARAGFLFGSIRAIVCAIVMV